ncbi:uncharacterized protein LOC124133855 [Haliotis rufescens]|uniref:uncharacterized protein LOC124133855 n=1 Tax=Haliotis rufescens TaxID=6454 RepID=UPI001EB09077|nr:uncharacterized protein LOC124133855 [Haliotis rufescens]
MWWVIAVLGRPVDRTLLAALTVVCTLVVCGVKGECPQDVKSQAYSCFTDYSSQYQNMQYSQRKMCCGVDVETLRAFCSSFVQAMQCLDHLKGRCPAEKHKLIDQTKQNLKGAEQGLRDLCSDDNIYEKYARHQNCFALQGYVSEDCLTKYMNNSIRLMSKVNRKTIDELCRDMRNAMNCIKPNIQAMCGVEASKLVEILIKPMVRDSAQCDYNIIHIESTEKPQQHQPGHTPSSMDDKNKYKSKYITDNGNGASSLVTSQRLPAALTVLLSVIILQARR